MSEIIIREKFIGTNVTEWISREHGVFTVRARLRGHEKDFEGVVDVEVLKGDVLFVDGGFRPRGRLTFNTMRKVDEHSYWTTTFETPEELKVFAEAISLAWELRQEILGKFCLS